MQLTLLSYSNSRLALLPDKVVRYDKSLGLCYTGNPDVDSLIDPNVDYDFAKTLWRAKFNEYCVVTNTKIEEDVIFLYGNNLSGRPVYIIFLHPVAHIRRLCQQGLILGHSNLISRGEVDESMLTLSPEEKTKVLFATYVAGVIDIFSRKSANYLTRFDFFNSQGELFHTDYKTAVLRDAIMDQASGIQIFSMKLQ
ncbi:hypothetical protein [Ehrlichia japonica]|uniref:Uncharacterized protein n=1 Tax=Ehrlichia japonica TaxID=391036 RepID=X5H3J5_9RICK|nr:hypothetical protein [Ehrlichia japonica]AHX04645.1 hypothetical protein EHF_0492 [Ehrlichia japonica]